MIGTIAILLAFLIFCAVIPFPRGQHDQTR